MALDITNYIHIPDIVPPLPPVYPSDPFYLSQSLEDRDSSVLSLTKIGKVAFQRVE
jgi:hypothetical protein